MEFFDRFFKRKKIRDDDKEEKEIRVTPIIPDTEHPEPSIISGSPDWADSNITAEEKERVAVIAAACLASSLPQKKYRVKRVLKVDEDWIVAGLAAVSGVSRGESNEKYRIQSIKRIK